MRKIFGSILVFIITGLIVLGCEPEAESPDITFFLEKQWKVSEIQLQDEVFLEYFFSCESESGQIDKYRIALNEDLTFQETDFCGGKNSGTWSLEFDGQILQLLYLEKSSQFVPDTLEYIIESLEIREVILKLVNDESKIGDSGIRLKLEPVKS